MCCVLVYGLQLTGSYQCSLAACYGKEPELPVATAATTSSVSETGQCDDLLYSSNG